MSPTFGAPKAHVLRRTAILHNADDEETATSSTLSVSSALARESCESSKEKYYKFTSERIITANGVDFVVLAGIPPSPDDIILPSTSQLAIEKVTPSKVLNAGRLNVIFPDKAVDAAHCTFASKRTVTVDGVHIAKLSGIPRTPSDIDFPLSLLSILSDGPVESLAPENSLLDRIGLTHALHDSHASGSVAERTMIVRILKQGALHSSSSSLWSGIWRTFKAVVLKREA